MSAPRLTIASIATGTPMGAEAYQEQIARRAPEALAEVSDREWVVRRLTLGSMRASLPGARRIPLGRIARAPEGARQVIGRALFSRNAVTHRMNLELPPAPSGDVITLHDVIAWRYPDESPPVAAAAAEARRAAAVICVSQHTAAEAVELLGIDPPHVVHNGVDDRFFGAAGLTTQRRNELRLTGDYVLHAGGATRRKNLEALADAWPRVLRARPHLQLALAGPAHPRRTQLFDGMPGVTLLGRLPEQDMPGLVASATAVVIPSLHEGFGLPALEAMAAGVPVVAAATSALPEVVGDAGLLVEPTPDGIVDGLVTVAAHDGAIEALVRTGRARAAEFTWERSAAGHARVWDSVGI
ncbi:MAG: glycosyltransferase [Nostocoides sp.]